MNILLSNMAVILQVILLLTMVVCLWYLMRLPKPKPGGFVYLLGTPLIGFAMILVALIVWKMVLWL